MNNQWTGAVRRGIIPSISGLISCAVSCLLLCVLCSSVCCSLCSLVVGCPDGRPGGQHHVLFLTAYILPTHNLPASTSKQSRVRSVESQQQYQWLTRAGDRNCVPEKSNVLSKNGIVIPRQPTWFKHYSV